MRTDFRRIVSAVLLLLASTLSLTPAIWSHPEDEFCSVGSDMDPALCRALADLDSDAPPPTTSDLLARTDRTIFENTAYFMDRGVNHILPGGSDHILFVLALFFSVRTLRPLLLQVSVFTLAHSVSLGLAAAGLVYVPSSIVEPLIAASIAFVAIENIFFRRLTPWRPLIIFGFGLLHGLGFAGFFLDQQLPDGFFWSSLIGFNIGVELGQLSVVLLAWLLFSWFFRKDWYARFVVIPVSVCISLVGLWWAVQRVFFT